MLTTTEVSYIADEGDVLIHVRLYDENGKPRPVRGSPFRPSFTKNARHRANDWRRISLAVSGLPDDDDDDNHDHDNP